MLTNMSLSHQFSLEEDMTLAAQIKKHPCLYSRYNIGYKKDDHCSKAWEAIGEALGLDKDLCARKFQNMKKRYSKKRCSATKASSAEAIARARKNLEAYSFLDWLNPHIRVRTMIPDEGIPKETQNNNQRSTNNNQNAQDSSCKQSPSHLDNGKGGNPNEAMNNKAQKHQEIVNGNHRDDGNIQQRRREDKEQVSVNEEESFSLEPPSMGYVDPCRTSGEGDSVSRNADQAFANMVAAELTSFPQHIKYCIKHEINNIFFKYHTAEFEQQNTHSTP